MCLHGHLQEEQPEALDTCISDCEREWGSKQNAQSRVKATEMQVIQAGALASSACITAQGIYL